MAHKVSNLEKLLVVSLLMSLCYYKIKGASSAWNYYIWSISQIREGIHRFILESLHLTFIAGGLSL